MRVITGLLITLLSASLYGAPSAHLVVKQTVQKTYLDAPIYVTSTIINEGPDTAVNTVLSITFPQWLGVAYPASYVNVLSGCSDACNVGNLAPGQQRTFVTTLKAYAHPYQFWHAVFEIVSTASSPTPDPTPPDLTTLIEVEPGPEPHFFVEDPYDLNPPLYVGETTPFFLVAVAGPTPLRPHTIHLVLESGSMTVYPSGGACSGSATDVLCRFQGALSTLTMLHIDITADAPGPVRLTASLTFDGIPGTTTRTLEEPVSFRCGSSLTASGPPDHATGLPLAGSLSWTTANPVESNILYLGPAGSGCTTPFAVTSGNSTVDYLLEPNTAYEWRVESLAGYCPVTSSACQTFTTGNDCTVMPTLIEPLGGIQATSPITFRWADVPNATNYHVLTATADGPFIHRATTTGTSAVIALPPGHTRWYVSAEVAGCSDVRSPTASFEVTAPKKRRSAG